jgi:phospholipid transport system substrate-binding protein
MYSIRVMKYVVVPPKNPHSNKASSRLCTLMALALVLGVPGAFAAEDPAATQIESFDSALLDAMKAGDSAGITERSRKLAPVIESIFDLRAMTAFAVGPAWSGFSTEQQQAAIAAFTRLTVLSFAHNFHSFGGERFELDPTVVTRGSDKIVQTHLVTPEKAPISLLYRMHQAADSWKIIDIYYGAVSQLSIRRSDFAAPIASGGATELIAHLNSLSEALEK